MICNVEGGWVGRGVFKVYYDDLEKRLYKFVHKERKQSKSPDLMV